MPRGLVVWSLRDMVCKWLCNKKDRSKGLFFCARAIIYSAKGLKEVGEAGHSPCHLVPFNRDFLDKSLDNFIFAVMIIVTIATIRFHYNLIIHVATL